MTRVNAALADRLVIVSVKLTRWLRLADPSPKLSGPEASALAVIVYSRRIKPSELAVMEEVKRPTIARTIGQLTEKGLVRRIADRFDARSVFLAPTPAAIKLIEDGQRRRIEPLQIALTKVSVGERRALEAALKILERVIDNQGAATARPITQD